MALLDIALGKGLFQKIEGKLHNRHNIRARVQQWYANAEAQTPLDQSLTRPAFDELGAGHGQAKRSDSTAITVIRRTVPPPDIQRDERWLKVIDSVMEKLKPDKRNFFEAYYNGRRGKHKIERVCERLYLGRSRGYAWRDEIVNITALVAISCGLLKKEKKEKERGI